MIINAKGKIKGMKEKEKIYIPEYFGKKLLDQKVASILLNHVIKNKSNPIITYGEIAKEISTDFNPRNLDIPLGNISYICKENGLPLISSVVVNKETRLPGEGFYREFYCEQPMSKWGIIFEECKAKVIEYTLWEDLLDAISEL